MAVTESGASASPARQEKRVSTTKYLPVGAGADGERGVGLEHDARAEGEGGGVELEQLGVGAQGLEAQTSGAIPCAFGEEAGGGLEHLAALLHVEARFRFAFEEHGGVGRIVVADCHSADAAPPQLAGVVGDAGAGAESGRVREGQGRLEHFGAGGGAVAEDHGVEAVLRVEAEEQALFFADAAQEGGVRLVPLRDLGAHGRQLADLGHERVPVDAAAAQDLFHDVEGGQLAEDAGVLAKGEKLGGGADVERGEALRVGVGGGGEREGGDDAVVGRDFAVVGVELQADGGAGEGLAVEGLGGGDVDLRVERGAERRVQAEGDDAGG